MTTETDTAPLPALGPEELYRPCGAELPDFETTEELEEFDTVVGQERALDAVRFGVRMGASGYNLYVLGRPGTSKHATVRQFLEREAAERERPDDWCYVNNFEDSHKPVALRTASGPRGGSAPGYGAPGNRASGCHPCGIRE